MGYPPLDITFGDQRIGTVRFIEVPHAKASRTAYGFRIEVPVEITLQPTQAGHVPVVFSLSIRLLAADVQGVDLELGTLTNETIYIGSNHAYNSTQCLQWTGPLSALVEYEKARNGRAPRFRVGMTSYVSLLLAGQAGLEPCTVPRASAQYGDFEYSAEFWRDILRRIRLADLVSVEIPLDPAPPDGYEKVWRELDNARKMLLRGGDHAWQSCANAVRQGL